jgi:hypothetical protein
MPTQRGTATTATAASGTSVTANKPTGVVSGDLLLAVFTNNNQTVTRPSGWTQLFYTSASTGNSWSTGVYYKVAGASEPSSYTFSVPSAFPLVLSITAWSGVDNTTPIGTQFADTASGSVSEPHTGPAKTVTITDGRLIYVRAVRYAGSTVPTFSTAAGGVTELVDVGIFSGGTVCYANCQYADNADFTTSGSKAGLAVSCSQAESDNLEATIALKSAATPVAGTLDVTLPAVSSDFAGGPHFDAALAATLPSLSYAGAGFGQPAPSSGSFDLTLPSVSSSMAGATAARGAMSVAVLPKIDIQAETRVFGVRVIAVEFDDSRRIIVQSRGLDD